MNRLKTTLIVVGLSALSASAAIGLAHAGEYEYVYIDDFTTDKVTTDSYEHSPILYYDPGPSLGGTLVLWPWPTYEPGLAFWPGFEFGDAVLRYRFPLVPISGNITGGTVGFDIELHDPFSGFWLDVKVSYDDENWEALDHITTPGYYEYPLSPPDSISRVYLEFLGGMAVLSNLFVQLNMTGVEFICGDINGHWDGPNVADVTYFVDYLFFDGSPPPVLEVANLDGVGGINIADLTYLVDYLFFGGSEPDCP